LSKRITIALDAMGGDYGVSVVVPSAFLSLKNNPNLDIVLVGQERLLEPLVSKYPDALQRRCRIHHASQSVDMDEPPAQALRFK